VGEDAPTYHTVTNEDWNPFEEVLHHRDYSREFMEMRTIHSLTSGLTRRQINALTEEEVEGGRRLEDNWMKSA
jgi:hypothetical protein